MLRTILKWLCIAFLGVIGVVLALRLPAHLDIRSVRPELPLLAEMTELASAPNLPNKVSYILTSSQSAPGREVGIHSFVVEWQDGKRFLIDAGMDEANAIEFGELLEWMWGAETATVHTTAAEALEGVLDNLQGVGLTHLHIDHTQGLTALCKVATDLQLFQTQIQRTMHNSNTTEGAEISARCPQAPALDGTVLTPVPGFPGLALYTLGGHTPGSTLFVVSTENQTYLFSGDITNTKDALLENRGKGYLYSYVLVPEDVQRTAALRQWLRELDAMDGFTVVVAHDNKNVRETLDVFGAAN